jgi:hypothetical protein
MNQVNTPPVSCQICGAVHGQQYWRHPELYHQLSTDVGDGWMWYNDTPHLQSKQHMQHRFTAEVRECSGKLLCQDCRKPYENALARNEKITRKNAQREAAGQKRLPGF